VRSRPWAGRELSTSTPLPSRRGLLLGGAGFPRSSSPAPPDEDERRDAPCRAETPLWGEIGRNIAIVVVCGTRRRLGDYCGVWSRRSWAWRTQDLPSPITSVPSFPGGPESTVKRSREGNRRREALGGLGGVDVTRDPRGVCRSVRLAHSQNCAGGADANGDEEDGGREETAGTREGDPGPGAVSAVPGVGVEGGDGNV